MKYLIRIVVLLFMLSLFAWIVVQVKPDLLDQVKAMLP
jgi:hypothetical protein